MGLLSPWFLAALGALAVPTVLHLIQRQRYPERPFTTLRFFDKTVKHNVIQRRFVDKLLLVLRLIMLAALAIALARPFAGLGFGRRSLAVAIVVDNSPSMARPGGEPGRTLLDAAREEAERLMASLGDGDQAAAVFTARAQRRLFTTDRASLGEQLRLRDGQPTGLLARDGEHVRPVFDGLTSDAAALREALDRIPPETPIALCGYGIDTGPRLTGDLAAEREKLRSARVSAVPGDLRSAVEQAGRLLQDSVAIDRVVVVLSDLQAGDWPEASSVALPGAQVRVVDLSPSRSAASNVSIEDCLVPERPVRLGRHVRCTARIRNHGSAATGPATYLEVRIAGERRVRKVPVQAVPPGGEALVNFPVPALGRGRTLFGTVAVQSPGDAFAYDDEWHFQIALRPPLPVLCVGRAGESDPTGGSDFFVRNALSPRTGAGAAEAFADVQQCSPVELEKRPLYPFSVIVLSGVDRLTTEARDKLRAFVSDGGGLVVFPGGSVDPAEYNGWGLLPARVSEVREGTFTYVKRLTERSVAAVELAERVGLAVQSLSANWWLALEPTDGASVLAELSEGPPALVAGPFGSGRVILAAASAHTARSDWPLRPAFVPLVRALVSHAADGGAADRIAASRAVGEGLAGAIPPEIAGGRAGAFRMEVTGVDSRFDPLPWLRRGRTLTLPESQAPGHYLLSIQPAAAHAVLSEPGLGATLIPAAVNHSPAESALRPISADRIRELLAADDVAVVTPGEGGAVDLAALRSGREYWRFLAVAALLVLLAEGMIAWRWASDAGA